MPWQEYAFRRSTDAKPFPSIMGRVCPAPCQDGCNRNEVEDFVGINSVEQFSSLLVTRRWQQNCRLQNPKGNPAR
jgi:NADPH-dependent glutamate synthase beta subunit-like oxidoreductase